jgi:hypothetical protein
MEISIKKWIHCGNVFIATDSLNHNDPMHPYNQAKEQGVKPEEYDLKHPLTAMFEGKNREDLILEILQLRKEIQGYVQNGF